VKLIASFVYYLALHTSKIDHSILINQHFADRLFDDRKRTAIA